MFILHRMAAALNLEDALQTALAKVAELFELHTGWIFLQLQDTGDFYLAAAQNLPPALADDSCRLMEGECTCLDSYRKGGLKRKDRINVITCSRLEELLAGTDGLRYHASIPLYAHGKPLGVLNVASAESRWWVSSAEKLNLLHTVGDLLSIAIERAYLFAQSTELGVIQERNRLAREIHDTLAQSLTGIALQLDTVDAMLEAGTETLQIRRAVQKRLALTQASLEEARRSVLDLWAAPLAGRDLAEAIEALVREQVRLMISYRATDRVIHTRFDHLPNFLEPGDLLVINTSGTLKAVVKARRADGTPVVVHLSTRLPARRWVVEVRRPAAVATQPFLEGIPGETLALPGGAAVTLERPYPTSYHIESIAGTRLWVATLDLLGYVSAYDYLAEYGEPIRYGYVKESWPIDYYQTVYATEPGSAEMPSAGRAFTPKLLIRLVAGGVEIAPLLLHTGVASLEKQEPPYAEYYLVPAETARRVNTVRAAGRRVIAVGTTAVRALETVTDESGRTHPGQGWTELVITPERGIRAVNGMLTGLHEPEATHLMMLQALAGLQHLHVTYAEALRQRYLWHEFGDLHLILP